MALHRYNEVIALIKRSYNEIKNEKVSTTAGYEKLKLFMTDITEKAGVPAQDRGAYLTRETIEQCLMKAEASIQREKEQKEKARLEALRKEERALAEKASILFSGSGKSKTTDYCQKYTRYYEHQILSCDKALASLEGDASRRHAMFNHTSNTWAYHGGIAEAIAGPAAGLMMASQAKQRDDERNAMNAQLMALNIQYTFERKKEINAEKEKYQQELKFWQDALESTKYQLEEQRDNKELLQALAPEVIQYTASETGTVTLEIKLSPKHGLKIYGEKKAYVDGSITVQFWKGNTLRGSTVCYLPFVGTENAYGANCTCTCTSLPPLSPPDERYDIKFLPDKLCLVESISSLDAVTYRAHHHFDEVAEWYYEKKKEKEAAQQKAKEEQETRKAQAQQLAILKQKQEAEREQRAKKRREFLRKHRSVLIASAAAMVVAISLLIAFFPTMKYNAATRQYRKGNYAKATEIFESLGDYKDSYEQFLSALAGEGRFRVLVEEYGVTDIIIPDGITCIEDRAFSGLWKLKSVTIPDSVTSIGESAFYNCDGLTSITIPDGVKTIERYAFSACSKLKKVTIPPSVTRIDPSAFDSSINAVHISDMAAWCGLYLAYSPFGGHTDLYLNGELVTNLVIPDGTKRIFSGTFQGFQSLTDVTIPESVTEIDSSAFSGCSNLTNVTIPESVTVIGSSAFSGCSSLTNVTIPESVTKIGSFAFSGCSSLTSVIVPESVTRIEYCAFSDCPSLTIYCEATKKPSNWDRDWNRSSYVMWGYAGEHGVTDDGFRWGSTTSGIVITGYHGTAVDVVIPDAISGNPVVSIQNTFQRNTTITGVTIPESVTEIVSSAFSGCSSLTSITIPDSVKSIGESAFSGCTSLTSAVFADPNGWHRSLYEGSSDSYYISSVYLSKSSDAAKYLTSTYNTYYWFKE